MSKVDETQAAPSPISDDSHKNPGQTPYLESLLLSDGFQVLLRGPALPKLQHSAGSDLAMTELLATHLAHKIGWPTCWAWCSLSPISFVPAAPEGAVTPQVFLELHQVLIDQPSIWGCEKCQNTWISSDSNLTKGACANKQGKADTSTPWESTGCSTRSALDAKSIIAATAFDSTLSEVYSPPWPPQQPCPCFSALLLHWLHPSCRDHSGAKAKARNTYCLLSALPMQILSDRVREEIAGIYRIDKITLTKMQCLGRSWS